MDPAYKILAKSPVPVLMAGTPRSVNLPELRDQVLAALGQPNRTGVEGSPTAFEGSSRFGTDPRKFNRPTASGAMENLSPKIPVKGTYRGVGPGRHFTPEELPITGMEGPDWLAPVSNSKERMKGAAKEYAQELVQRHGSVDEVLKTLLGGPGTLLNKATMQARDEFSQLNLERDQLKTRMWNLYGYKGPNVVDRLPEENSRKKWKDLSPETRTAITRRVNEATEAEFVRRGMPGTESVLRELLKDSKVGRESRVSFPLQSPQKGPNESDAAYARRRAQFMEEHKGAIDFYRKTGVVPEDPARSGAIWYDPHAPVDPYTQNFEKLADDSVYNKFNPRGQPIPPSPQDLKNPQARADWLKLESQVEDSKFAMFGANGERITRTGRELPRPGNPFNSKEGTLGEALPSTRIPPSPYTPPATKGHLAQADSLEDLSRTLWKKLESYTGLAPDEQDMYQKRVSLLSKKLKEAANLFRNDEDEGRVALRKIIPHVQQLNQELDVGAPPIKMKGGGGLVNRASGAKDPLDLLIQQETIERLQRDPTKLIEELPYENLGQVQMGLEQSQPQKLRQALGHLAAPSDYRIAAESQAAVPTPDLPIQSLLAETRTPVQKGTFMGAMERLPGSVSRLGAEGGSFIRNPEGRRFIQEGGSFVEKALRRLAQRL